LEITSQAAKGSIEFASFPQDCALATEDFRQGERQRSYPENNAGSMFQRGGNFGCQLGTRNQ
jgi:hypothetical protein